MTAAELLARYEGPLHPGPLLSFIVVHWYDLEIVEGSRRRPMRDVTDAQAVIAALAETFRATRRGEPERCPECGHVHELTTYCAHYLGEMKFCQCEAKVTA